MHQNGPNILSHLALGNDGPHLSIDDNYVADFAIGNRGHGLCKTPPLPRLSVSSRRIVCSFGHEPLPVHPAASVFFSAPARGCSELRRCLAAIGGSDHRRTGQQASATMRMNHSK